MDYRVNSGPRLWYFIEMTNMQMKRKAPYNDEQRLCHLFMCFDNGVAILQ